MRTVKGTTKAWLTEYRDPEVLNGDNPIGNVSYSNTDMAKHGWTFVGEADVTLHIFDEKKVVENKIVSLKAEKDSILAEAQARATIIEGKIKNLLAITYVPEEA